MKAADIMTRHIFTLNRDDTLDRAIRLMLKHGISGLPVVDRQGRIEGMLTEGDLLRRPETGTDTARTRWLAFLLGPRRLAEEYVHSHSLRVKDVMTHHAITAAPDMPLAQVVALMEHHHVKRIPVLDQGQLVGIISRANLIRFLQAAIDDIPDAQPSDEAIRQRLQQELEKSAWAPVALNTFIVRNGIVDLYGNVTSQAESDALRVAAENIPGVKSVRSHLMLCDPSSAQLFALPEEEMAPPRQAQDLH